MASALRPVWTTDDDVVWLLWRYGVLDELSWIPVALTRRWIGQWLSKLSLVNVNPLWHRISGTDFDSFLNELVVLLHLVHAAFLHRLGGCVGYRHSSH